MKQLIKILKFLLNIILIFAIFILFNVSNVFNSILLGISLILIVLLITFKRKAFFIFKIQLKDFFNSLTVKEKENWKIIKNIIIGIFINIFTSIIFPHEVQSIHKKLNLLIKGINRIDKKLDTIQKTINIKKSTFSLNVFDEYNELIEKDKRYKELLKLKPNDSTLIKEIAEIEHKIQQLQYVFVMMSKKLEPVKIDTKRLYKTKEYIIKGDLNNALLTLNENDLLNEQKELLEKRNNSVLDSVRNIVNNKLIYNSNEFITKAQLHLLQISNKSRYSDAERLYKLAIKSSPIAILDYAKYLSMIRAYENAIKQYDLYIKNYNNFKTKSIYQSDTVFYNLKILSNAYLAKGISYSKIFDYDKSEQNIYNALKIAKSINKIDKIAISYKYLSDIFFKQGKISDAKTVIDSSLAYAKHINDTKFRIESGINYSLAKLFIKFNKIDKAKNLINEELNYYTKKNNCCLERIITAKFIYSQVLYNEKKYFAALNYLLEVEKYYKEEFYFFPKNDNINYIATLLLLSDTYLALNNEKKAKEKLQLILFLLKSEVNKKEIDLNKKYYLSLTEFRFGNLYLKINEKNNALNYYNKAIQNLKQLIKSYPKKIEYKKQYASVICSYYESFNDAFSIYAISNLIKKMEKENPTETFYKNMIEMMCESKMDQTLYKTKKIGYFRQNSVLYENKTSKNNYLFNGYVKQSWLNKDHSVTYVMQDTVNHNIRLIKLKEETKHNTVYK